MNDRYTIAHIECDRGILTVKEALTVLAEGHYLNRTLNQVVMGVYADGKTRTSLKGHKDGLYYMSGSLAVTL